MILYRLKLHPRSPWRTPWQADTLTGLLLATCARVHGARLLCDRLIEPMLDGQPPFVLSDACPGDLLPIPAWVRLAAYPEDQRKAVKRARWLSRDAFQVARVAQVPRLEELIPDEQVFLQHHRYHNTLSRLRDATGLADSGLAPFNRTDVLLRTHTYDGSFWKPNPILHDRAYFSVYYRILDGSSDTADLLLDLFHELSLVGFGADVATGRGQFDLIDPPEPMPDLDALPREAQNANAVVSLSTFQPGSNDPTAGLWEAFPKFGKLGPDLGLPNEQIHKRPLILFRPGACFSLEVQQQRGFLGRAVPMQELLTPSAAADLKQRGLRVIHPAFALTLPAQLNLE